MSRLTSEVRLAAETLDGRADAAPGAPGPYLILDLGRGCDPHQARCQRCRWRSGLRATAAQARAEHDRHQIAAHTRGRGRHGGLRGRLGLAARGRPR
jgi:hypothetical protein